MKIRLLVDSFGPNPEFKPPDPRIDLTAWMTYRHKVSYQIVIPCGTEIEDPWAWIHCLPNSAGIVIAEPIDDDAKLMVEGESKTLREKEKRIFDNHNARRETLRLQELANKPPEPQPEPQPEEPDA